MDGDIIEVDEVDECGAAENKARVFDVHGIDPHGDESDEEKIQPLPMPASGDDNALTSLV